MAVVAVVAIVVALGGPAPSAMAHTPSSPVATTHSVAIAPVKAAGDISGKAKDAANRITGAKEEKKKKEESGNAGAAGECSSKGGGYFDRMLVPNPDASTSYMTCSPEYYYLTYVNYEKIGVFSEEGRENLVAAPGFAGLNTVASLIFEINAKLASLMINLLDFALEFAAADLLSEVIDTVTAALGEGIMKVYLPLAYALAVFIGAYQAMVRSRFSSAVSAIAVAAVVGAFGMWIISGSHASMVDKKINEATNTTTDLAFGALAEMRPPDNNESLQCANLADPGACVYSDIWNAYVHDPWSRMQISLHSGKLASAHAGEILPIAESSKRAEKLSSLAESEDDIKQTTSATGAGWHLTATVLTLLNTLIFGALLVFLAVLSIVSEFLIAVLVVTSPIWLLGAVIPSSGVAVRFGLLLLGEIVQLFAYKLLIAIFLLIIGGLFAASLPLGATLILCAVVSFTGFKFRKQLYALLQPAGIVKNLAARYDRGRAIRADRAASEGGLLAASSGGARPSGSFSSGGWAAAGTPNPSSSAAGMITGASAAGAAGVSAAGAAAGAAGGRAASNSAPWRRTSTFLRQKTANMPGLGRRADRLAMAAGDLDALAAKRAAAGPEALTAEEHAQLAAGESLIRQGKDPLSVASYRERYVKSAAGVGTGQRNGEQLGLRRQSGESEADYMARVRDQRAHLHNVADHVGERAKEHRSDTILAPFHRKDAGGYTPYPGDYTEERPQAHRPTNSGGGRPGGGGRPDDDPGGGGGRPGGGGGRPGGGGGRPGGYTPYPGESKAHRPTNSGGGRPATGHWRERTHAGLDAWGLAGDVALPGTGVAADALNAGLYLSERRYGDAAISATAMVPLAGDAAKAPRMAATAARYSRAARARRLSESIGGEVLEASLRPSPPSSQSARRASAPASRYAEAARKAISTNPRLSVPKPAEENIISSPGGSAGGASLYDKHLESRRSDPGSRRGNSI